MLIHIVKQVYKFTNYEEAVCKVKQALEKTDEERKQEGRKIALERNFIQVAKQLKKIYIKENFQHADFEKCLDEQLTRLKIDYIDVYLLHNFGFENWEIVIKYDDLAFLDKMVRKGKIHSFEILIILLCNINLQQLILKSVDVNQTKYTEVM